MRLILPKHSRRDFIQKLGLASTLLAISPGNLFAKSTISGNTGLVFGIIGAKSAKIEQLRNSLQVSKLGHLFSDNLASIDVLYVANSSQATLEMLRQAAENGKHIVLEKGDASYRKRWQLVYYTQGVWLCSAVVYIYICHAG